ncbi:MAG TPA: transglutaminase-like domain-containing protein [Bacteroidales bacterium]|nr:transglutaminase-like domain-containing protein [Bacteroidales bacterium]
MQNDTLNHEMQALVSLLDDPDANIFNQVSAKIHGFGLQAIPFLQNAWENCLDPLVQSRIEEILYRINLDNVAKELSQAFEHDCKDLLQAWISFSRFQYPGLNEDELRLEIQKIRKDVWLELNNNLTALEQIKVFNQVFYEMHGFSGNNENYFAPDNFFINRVISSRKGNPVSLSALYQIIAQSLDLPVYGVNLPEHFILAYTGKGYDLSTMRMEDNKVLFYINPFSKGLVFSAPEVEKFIKNLNLEPLQSYFNPCSNGQIIMRMITSLISSYESVKQPDKQRDLEQIREFLLENSNKPSLSSFES